MKYVIDEEELIGCLYHKIDIIAVKSLLKSEQPVELVVETRVEYDDEEDITYIVDDLEIDKKYINCNTKIYIQKVEVK